MLLTLVDELIARAREGWESTGDPRGDLREIGLRLHAFRRPTRSRPCLWRTGRPGGAMSAPGVWKRFLRRRTGPVFSDWTAVRIHHALVDRALAFAAVDTAVPALLEPVWEGDADGRPGLPRTGGFVAPRCPRMPPRCCRCSVPVCGTAAAPSPLRSCCARRHGCRGATVRGVSEPEGRRLRWAPLGLVVRIRRRTCTPPGRRRRASPSRRSPRSGRRRPRPRPGPLPRTRPGRGHGPSRRPARERGNGPCSDRS